METIVYFVRHGKVDSKDICYGRLPGFGLSALGFQQACTAAEALKDVRPAAIYSSPMLRARQTAHIIRHFSPNLKIRITHLINETFIPYDGWSLKELEKINWDIFTGTQPPYEQPADLVKRMRAFVDKVRQEHPGQPVIAVSHADPIAWFIKWALGIPLSINERNNLFPAEASVSKFVFPENDGGKVIYEQFHPRSS